MRKKKKVKKKTRFNLIANTNIENNNIKLSKVNVEKHRLSIINLDSLVKEQFNKKKSISAINIRNKESNEVKIIKSISKSNHISTREDLIYLTILKNTKKLDKFTLYQESHNLNYLLLENYSGKLLLKNLIIEPLGLIKYSRRNAKDTLTFFGYSEYKDYNDYVLNNTSFIYDNKLFTKTFLAISYDINYNIYFIQPILDKKKQGKFVLPYSPKSCAPQIFRSFSKKRGGGYDLIYNYFIVLKSKILYYPKKKFEKKNKKNLIQYI